MEPLSKSITDVYATYIGTFVGMTGKDVIGVVDIIDGKLMEVEGYEKRRKNFELALTRVVAYVAGSIYRDSLISDDPENILDGVNHSLKIGEKLLGKLVTDDLKNSKEGRDRFLFSVAIANALGSELPEEQHEQFGSETVSEIRKYLSAVSNE